MSRFNSNSVMVLFLVLAAFNLGRYSVEFSGGMWAWIAVVADSFLLLWCTFWLIRKDRRQS